MKYVTRETVRHLNGEVVPTKSFYFWPGFGNVPFAFDVPIPGHDIVVLREVYTPNSDGDRSAFKDFEHYKLEVSEGSGAGLEFLATYGSNPFRTNYFEASDHYAFLSGYIPGIGGAPLITVPAFYDGSVEEGRIPLPSSLDELLQSAYSVMMPAIKNELSLANSLYELKDFKDLPELVSRIGSILSKALSFGNISKTLHQILGGARDVYLQKEFNVLPLLSDIAGVRTAMLSFERKLNSLLTQQGKLVTRHYTRFINEYSQVYDTFRTDNADWSQNDSNFVIGRIESAYSIEYKPTVFHYELQFNYNYSAYDLEHARFNAICDALGLNLNPQILWNAVKWSFVVDWLIGVSRFLKQFTLHQLEPRINFVRGGYSIKRERIIRSRRRFFFTDDDVPHYVGSFSPLPEVKETAYRRVFHLPTTSSISRSGLSLKEFSLGAALVLPRSRHQRKKH